MAKTMVSKFAGKCKACGAFFPAGAFIVWSRAEGARHASPGACEAAKAAAAAAPPVPEVKAEGAPIAAFLGAAKERGLKYPKVRFLAPSGGTLVLSLAGAKARVPGSINVLIEREWLGRIEPGGEVVGRALRGDAKLLALLATIAADPAKAAKEFGALRAACSFCGLALDDAGSVEVGYGPVCAKRYGLPWKRGGAPVLAVPVLPFEAPVKAALAVAEKAGIDPAPPEASAEVARATKLLEEARAVLAEGKFAVAS